MFKRVHVASLRPGVFLHKLDAPWLTHGIWRQRFPVRDHRDAERIRKSGAVYCWIDLRKGIDPSVPDTSAAPEGSPATMAGALESPVPGAVVAAPPARDMASELSRAESICARGRKRVADLFSQARLGRAIEVAQCEDLVDDIAQSVARHAGALQSLVRMKSKDDYTYMHSLGVCTMMIALGRQMGLDEQTCRQAGLGGLLHDVGKARTPVDILNKAGPLSQEEFAIVKAHPLDGYNMLESIGVTVGMPALDVILHHHEHVDGGGYPHDLKLPELSLLARMGAICDVYDALTSERPYKTAWDPAESLARMASWRGKLDRAVLAEFVQSIGIYPPGSVVRLESRRVAVVLENHSARPTTPVVRTFFSLRCNMPIAQETIDLSRDGATDRIVGRVDRSDGGFAVSDEVWASAMGVDRKRFAALAQNG